MFLSLNHWVRVFKIQTAHGVVSCCSKYLQTYKVWSLVCFLTWPYLLWFSCCKWFWEQTP